MHTEFDTAAGRLARGLRTLALGLTAAVSCLPAAAQTAADITPPTLAPDARPLTGAVVFTGASGLGAPEGADRLTVTLRGVAVEGGFAAMAEAHRATEARLTGRVIPVSEVFQAAQDLEAAYAESGFVLARVVLPAQELRDGGTLRLVVVDGFVEAIEAEGLPPAIRARIVGVTAPLEGQRSLRLREIERALLIAGDTYGLALDSALAEGAVPGSTRLVLGGDFRPVTGFLGVDTGYSRDLGGYSLDSGVEFNGLMGMAETIYLRASGNPSASGASDGLFSSTPRMRTLAAGIIAPAGTSGLTWNLELTESRSTPHTDGPPTTSTFDRASFRLAYPVVRSREVNVTARASFDLQRDRQDVLAPDGTRLPIHRDSLRVLRLAAGLTRSLPEGGIDAFDAIASLGLDVFGARHATTDLPLSRDGARPSFAKLELSGRTVRPLGERLVLAVSGRAQTAFGRPLVKSEQMGIANASELSGFAIGTESGDSGIVLRGELRAPLQSEDLRALVTPYSFAASGILWLHQPTALEQGRRRLSSIGVGVEVLPLLDSRFTSATVRVEAARGIRHGGGPNDNRFTLVGTVRF
jgi:hemolysin activation/secretion protein